MLSSPSTAGPQYHHHHHGVTLARLGFDSAFSDMDLLFFPGLFLFCFLPHASTHTHTHMDTLHQLCAGDPTGVLRRKGEMAE